MFGNAVLGLGGPIDDSWGANITCWGDSTKHSSRDSKDALAGAVPLPNLNGGIWFSMPIDFIDTAFVVYPFGRGNEGRVIVALLVRLNIVSELPLVSRKMRQDSL